MILLDFNPIPRGQFNLLEPWHIGVFLVILVLIAVLRVNYPGRVGMLYQGGISTRFMRGTLKEQGSGNDRAGLIGFVVFLLIFGVFGQLLEKFGEYSIFGTEGPLSALIHSGLIAGLYALKAVVVYLLRFIVGSDFGLSEYLFNVFLYIQIFGFLIVAPVILMAFLPISWVSWLLGIVIGLFSLTFIMRVARGLINSLALRVSLFYILLYLCALEILPLMVIFTWLS